MNQGGRPSDRPSPARRAGPCARAYVGRVSSAPPVRSPALSAPRHRAPEPQPVGAAPSGRRRRVALACAVPDHRVRLRLPARRGAAGHPRRLRRLVGGSGSSGGAPGRSGGPAAGPGGVVPGGGGAAALTTASLPAPLPGAGAAAQQVAGGAGRGRTAPWSTGRCGRWGRRRWRCRRRPAVAVRGGRRARAGGGLGWRAAGAGCRPGPVGGTRDRHGGLRLRCGSGTGGRGRARCGSGSVAGSGQPARSGAGSGQRRWWIGRRRMSTALHGRRRSHQLAAVTSGPAASSSTVPARRVSPS